MNNINICIFQGNQDIIQDFFQNEAYVNLETDEFMTSKDVKDFSDQEYEDWDWSKDYIDNDDFFEHLDLLDYDIYNCSMLEEQWDFVNFQTYDIDDKKSLLIIALADEY